VISRSFLRSLALAAGATGLTADGKFDPATGEFGSSMIAASLPDLSIVNYFAPANVQRVYKLDLGITAGSPVWFKYRNYELVAGGGKEGVLFMLDANFLGGRDHQTPLFTTPRLANDTASYNMRGIRGAPAYWQDDSGQVWIFVPIWGPESKDAPQFPMTNGPRPHGCIMAFKVVLDKVSMKPVLTPAWVSSDFKLPDPPIVAIGIVFALPRGRNADQRTNRLESSGHAVYYALDAKKGQTLYDSDNEMRGWVHFSGLAESNGLVYAVDHNSWVYCFGPKEN